MASTPSRALELTPPPSSVSSQTLVPRQASLAEKATFWLPPGSRRIFSQLPGLCPFPLCTEAGRGLKRNRMVTESALLWPRSLRQLQRALKWPLEDRPCPTLVLSLCSHGLLPAVDLSSPSPSLVKRRLLD